jgi:hypothetical protein
LPEFAFFKQSAEVKVKPGAVGFLTCRSWPLGWYLMVRLSDESARSGGERRYPEFANPPDTMTRVNNSSDRDLR